MGERVEVFGFTYDIRARIAYQIKVSFRSLIQLDCGTLERYREFSGRPNHGGGKSATPAWALCSLSSCIDTQKAEKQTPRKGRKPSRRLLIDPLRLLRKAITSPSSTERSPRIPCESPPKSPPLYYVNKPSPRSASRPPSRTTRRPRLAQSPKTVYWGTQRRRTTKPLR